MSLRADATTATSDVAPTRATSPWPAHRTLLLIALGAATGLGGMFGVQRLVLRWVRDQPLDVATTLGIQLVPWLAWALAVPAIAALCRRYPVDAAPPLVSGLRWLAFAVIAMLLHTAACVLPLGVISGWELVNRPLWVGFQQLLVNRGVGAVSEFALIVAVLQAVAMAGRAAARDAQALALHAQLVDAELRALRLQLEPHFLFNTLNAIHAHVRDEPALAEEMLRHLADVLRSVLASGEQAERPLRDELALVRAYLRLHQVRFGDRLTVDVDSDPAAQDALAPALLLQPLVENAIAHGVAQRAGAASIKVTAHRAADRLVIHVEDSGAAAAAPADGGHGIGLANTRQRLAHHYGAEGSVSLERSPTRTVVTVHLPFRAVAA
jgi:two-component sensor histidine kinase